MEIVLTSIDSNLENLINEAYSSIKDKNQKNNIQIYNLYWDNNEKICLDILKCLKKYNIDKKDIFSFSFLHIKPGCKQDSFHVETNSHYYIPLSENLVEFIEFKSSSLNIALYPKLEKIENRFISKEGIIGYLNSIEISNDKYEFKNLICPPFSLIYSPDYIIRRIVKDNCTKIFFVITLNFNLF